MTKVGQDLGRREQVLAVTRAMILERGSLIVSLNEIADELGVSRSLIYVYFESVGQIIDELFAEEVKLFDSRISEFLDKDQAFRRRFIDLFGVYLDRLSAEGQLGYLVLRERNQDNPLGDENSRHFRRMLRKLSREVVDALSLTPREAFVFLELLAAIPESLARMVRAGKLDNSVAHETSELLIGSAIDAYAIDER